MSATLDELIEQQKYQYLPIVRRCAFCDDFTGSAKAITFAEAWEDEYDRNYPEVATERDGLCTRCLDRERNGE